MKSTLITKYAYKGEKTFKNLKLVRKCLYTKSVQTVSSHVLGKIETFIEGDTRCKTHYTQDNDTSVPFKLGTLGPHTVLSIAISHPIVFTWISSMVWNLFPFKGHFWEKPEVPGHQIWAVGGWVTWVICCLAKNLCTRCDAWAGTLLWWSCQPSAVHNCGLLNDLNYFCGGMFKLNTKSDVYLSLYSLSLFECDGHTVHMLTQQCLPHPLTSTVKSSLFTHAHASPLSLVPRLPRCCANHSYYINNGWTFYRQTSYNQEE